MEVKKLLKKAHKLMYKNLEENIKLANEFEDTKIDKKFYKEALAIYEQVLASDPGNKEALEGKKNAEIMLEPFYPQQTMTDLSPFSEPIETKRPVCKTPWEKKKALMHSQKTNLSYTATAVTKAHVAFENTCEKLLIEALEYSKTHTKEETFRLFSEKIKSQVPTSKTAYVGTDFDPTDFLERLKKMLKVIDR